MHNCILYTYKITQKTPPFGSAISEMQFKSDTGGSYRYGFNGEELMNELSTYDLGERFYDGRLGKMFSLDPLMAKYPWQSPYAYCYNNPIGIVDVKGMGGEPGTNTYKVESGDNVWNIAKNVLGSSATNAQILTLTNQIIASNYLNKNGDLKIGQELKIPGYLCNQAKNWYSNKAGLNTSKKETGWGEGKNIQSLNDGDWISDVQDQTYMLEINNVNNSAFEAFRKSFINDPGNIINNNLANYSHIDRDGSGGINNNDHFDIRIGGLAGLGGIACSVKVDNVVNEDNFFSMKVLTLKGHPDAGYNIFFFSYDPEKKSLTWMTQNVSRTQVPLSVLISSTAREKQIEQWIFVMGQVYNFVKNQDSKATVGSASHHIIEYHWGIKGIGDLKKDYNVKNIQIK
jgi:RHS repeat-associated protein